MNLWQVYGLKFSIMSLLAIVGPKFLNQYITKYISFLNTFAEPVASFIVIFILLLGTHFITKSVWAV